MASSHSLHAARRSRDQQPLSVSSQMNSCSEGTRLNHQRSRKPVVGRPGHRLNVLRECGYLKEGDAIQFFSRSADAWLDGEIVAILDDDLLRVDYQIGQYWISKTLHLDSENILIPSATEQCLEESDPMLMLSLAKTVFPKQCEWAEKKVKAIVPLVRTKKSAAKEYGTELFHQTDEATAEIILRTQEMKPGSQGVAGGGIYFATTAELTGHKAHAHGVILRAYVRLGRIKTIVGAGPDWTLSTLKASGHDSVCVDRTVSSGHEYVVYDPAQVLYIERV